MFFSPYSISTALAMTYAGARGNTEKEIRTVFHFDGNQHQVSSAFGVLQRRLNEAGKQQGMQLNIANALWAQKGHPFLPGFLDLAKREYQANINQADFKTAAGPACQEINHWVEQQTKGRIQGVLPPGSLDDLTRLVLANAIYFKGIWVKQFDKGATVPQPFHISPTRQVNAPLMYQLDVIRYMEEPEFQAVDLPYKGDELSMLILLPRQVDACANLERKLSPELLSRSLDKMKKQKVEMYLPKFKLESGFDLSGALSKMGMKDAFNTNADFSGMDGTNDLFISAVFHKAWGEVNEEGTEAAAATGVGFTILGYHPSPPPPPVFRADHPFIFFIREARSGSLLFIGRLVDPVS